MNKKDNLVLLFGLLLTACNLNIGGNNNSTNKISSSSLGENISSNSSTNGEESSSKIEYVDNVKMIDIEEYQDTHTYNNPNFKDFPNYSESQWNKNLKFTLSSDGTYYSVSDGTGADRAVGRAERARVFAEIIRRRPQPDAQVPEQVPRCDQIPAGIRPCAGGQAQQRGHTVRYAPGKPPQQNRSERILHSASQRSPARRRSESS